MNNFLHLRPVAGLPKPVLDPVTLQAIPESGRLVLNTSYWRRKLKQGLLEVVPETQAAEPAKPKKGAKA